ncbi:MAG: tetratricopeptide repeat protein [Myxococcaceae bacterium]|nr:tetratricopeptide repeat protein [Myxococcaceae bacterium]MCA3015015.1 tetratricopeptide repeat protein [Myxococcaceae bacterium]
MAGECSPVIEPVAKRRRRSNLSRMATRRTSRPAKKPSGASAPRSPPKRLEASPDARAVPKNTLPFEIDPKRVEESLKRFRDQLVQLTKKGRYTKVRFKFRGKQLLPDLPLAAVVAVEGATFYWTGLLRALVFNLAGRAVIDVELVNDSEKRLTAGKEALLSGDLEVALASFREALEMDPENPLVHLNLGVAYKLKGQREVARLALQQAKKLDPLGPTGAEAERLLAALGPVG